MEYLEIINTLLSISLLTVLYFNYKTFQDLKKIKENTKDSE